jgi:hypothetical protein
LAGLELNALRVAGTLGDEFERVRVPDRGTTIFDINGRPLFVRLPLGRGKEAFAYADVAVEPSLGAVLLAVSMGFPWNEAELLAGAARAARKGRRGLKYAYSAVLQHV